MSVRGCYQYMREANMSYVCQRLTNVYGRLRLSMSERGCYQRMREAKVIYICERLLPMYEGG